MATIVASATRVQQRGLRPTLFHQVKKPVTEEYAERSPILAKCAQHAWRKAWQPAPAFLPGESHGQRGLAGCNSWGCRESYTPERLTHTHNTHAQKEPSEKHTRMLAVVASGWGFKVTSRFSSVTLWLIQNQRFCTACELRMTL